ncbi:MAG: hypothetical protein KDD63_17380 [Bacteroidetes bacterium]|nr:hypothetical protein [Bacteroidota bacterium]MCB0842370.1 hypothetical protein [Bacteroidota bacterium]MCB0854003.1 hypothetical protein [Bacteroidota bacterium]
MVPKTIALSTWWAELSEEWQGILEGQLETNGMEISNWNDISCLKELDCSGSSITDLTPVSHFSSIESLDISETQVKDLRPLLQLPQLKELHLTFSQSLDLEIIGKLDKLEVLDISYPYIKNNDIHALSGLTNLRELYCNACNVDTVIHFITLQKLEILCVYFNPIPGQELDAFQELMPFCRILS